MEDETPLERMLRDAWQEPGLRPAFYKRLMESDVIVPVLAAVDQMSQGTIDAGTAIQVISLVRQDGRVLIPFFTSPTRLFEASPQGERCVVIPVRQLFEGRPDMHFFINPGSAWGREFSPWDVRSLLKTSGIAVTERVGTNLEKDVTLREPEQMPDLVLAALRTLYARNFDIRAAYIAERCGPDADEQGRMLIVVDLVDGGDQVRALRDTGTVITESRESDEPSFGVAVLRRDDSQASRYFQEQATPFYTIGLAGSITAALKL
jgi:hypothetical protein